MTNKIDTSEPFNCAACGRRIGARTIGHYLLTNGRVVCDSCRALNGTIAEAQAVHAVLFPECPEPGHDVMYHCILVGDRAGIHYQLMHHCILVSDRAGVHFELDDDGNGARRRRERAAASGMPLSIVGKPFRL